MQLLVKDKVHVAYAHGDLMLYELMSGAFQFGYGPDAQIIDALDQVEAFDAPVKRKVQDWLESGGLHAARQDKRARVIAEQSEKQVGLLDQLAMQAGGPELRAEMIELMTAKLKQRGDLPAADDASVPVVAGGVEVQSEAEQRADVLRRELATTDDLGEADPALGPITFPKADAGEMAEEVAASARPKRKR